MAPFASKICSRVLGDDEIDPKVGQECGTGLRQYIIGYHIYMIIWKPLVGKCLQCVKEQTNEVDKNVVAVVRANSHCKEVVGHVQQKSP